MPLPSVALRCAPLFVATAIGGCQSLQSSDNFLGVITPYRVEVVQGNVVTREQAARIKTGMSQAQVRDVLGSPLLVDAFHTDRWDYVFTIRRQGAKSQLRRLVLMFDADKLISIEGDGQLPGEREFVASIDTYKAPATPPKLALTEEQIKALPTPVRPAVATDAAPPPPARDYPPLEPLR